MISNILPFLIMAVLAVLLIYLPKLFTGRQRILVGLAFLLLGVVGLFLGEALEDRRFLQDDTIAYCWVGGFTALTIIGLILLVSRRR